MTLQQIGSTPPNFEAETTEVALGARKRNVSAPKDLLQVIARSTACSSIVFSGLLAWASLNAHLQPESRASGNLITASTRQSPQVLGSALSRAGYVGRQSATG